MFTLYGKLYSILKASFTFSGRATRKDFWLFFTFYALMYFAALGADVTYYQQNEPSGFLLALQSLVGGREPFVLLHLILLTPAMASITVRRLHDRGHTGWWGIVYLVPLVGLVPFFGMLARQGQAGFNRFGADPLAIESLSGPEPVLSSGVNPQDDAAQWAVAE